MKFQLALNLERNDDTMSMEAVRDHTLEMVQMADRGGFSVVWSAEHHALEMTIAPNPFQILTWLAGHTDRIRLGTAVAVAPYWNPISLAGEAAFTDLICNGRLEFGIGSGAYQREFDRMHPGLKQSDAWRYMHELLPAVKALWAGDYAHNGEFWSFPTSTSVPKPLQKPHPPIWVAARAPITFDYAVEHGCNILSWPLTMPFSEAETYRARLDEAIAKNGVEYSGTWAVMRHTAVYDNEADRKGAMDAVRGVLGQFGNLMMKSGDVINGFPEEVPLESLEGNARTDPEMLEENLMFGSPERVVEKLRLYEEIGVDGFLYYASMGMDMDQQKRSLQLFIDQVMPEFTEKELAHAG